jgi:hypothetical protein
LERQLSTNSLIKNDIFRARDALSLNHQGGRYSVIQEGISDTSIRRLAEIFFKALGGVGTSRFSIRLIHNGKDLHPAEFLSVRTGDGLIDHVTVKDRVLDQHLKKGATVVFDHVNDHVPFAQIIQDHVEAITGARCWVQCYITQGSFSAFNLHRDDHAFAIIQLFGRKEWRHVSEMMEIPASTIYSPGMVAFYPKATPHDVHALGELSMHLTIAFEGYDGYRFDKLPEGKSNIADIRRRGTGLPYSLHPELLAESTPARLALRHISEWSGDSNAIHVWTGTSKLAVPRRYAAVLRHLALTPSTTAAELRSTFNISTNEALEFYRFGFRQGLLLSPVQ